MIKKKEQLHIAHYALLAGITLATAVLCICLGSVPIPLRDTLVALREGFLGLPIADIPSGSIILLVRLPRVLCVMLVGASLSICGCAMQGLLRNPLADGSTLGVSSGASLGAVIALAFGFNLPGLPLMGTAALAMLFAFLSLILILGLSYRFDYSLSTNTIILVGVIFSMFVSSLISLITTFSGDKLRTVTFWMMGSLAQSDYNQAAFVAVALLIFGLPLLFHARELNAFAIGEENARNIGVDVVRVKRNIMILVSGLIGVCVSVGGVIGFVGLVMPHMTRMVLGPNHKKLLPAAMFTGSTFLMLADLISRTLFSPLELPIGVVTSFIGAIAFTYIFYQSRRTR